MIGRLSRKVINSPQVLRSFGVLGNGVNRSPYVLKSGNKDGWKSYISKLFKRNNKKDNGGEDPEWKPEHFLGLIGIGALGIAAYYQEYLREMLGLYRKLDYKEFIIKVGSGDIQKVTIIKVSHPGEPEYTAIVSDRSNNKYIVQVGNLDAFLKIIYRTDEKGNVQTEKLVINR